MKTIAIAFAALGMIASSAGAATLTKTSYTTARKAALAGAAYHFNKALKSGFYSTKDLKIAKAIDKSGPSQKYLVQSKNGIREKIVTVKMESAKKFRAFIPNKKVFTPNSTTRR